MNTILIAEIRLENDSKLIVKPVTGAFPYIYRAGLSVYWDDAGQYLYTDLFQGQSLPGGFKRLAKAAQEEYNIILKITDRTVWEGIPTAVRGMPQFGRGWQG